MTSGPEVEVQVLGADQDRAAAALAAQAFARDPYWESLGPGHAGLRRHVIAAVIARELRAGRASGDALLQIADGGTIVALARVAEQAGDTRPRLPAPAIAWCGPLAVVRWWRAEAGLAALRPLERHDYLYTLAVAPSRQRQGLGRSLLAAVLERANERAVPLLLDTMTADNVRYYEAFDFAVCGETPLPRGHRAWMMRLRTPG
jgi:ribosomal protein S18 acetylase RimI-like enzyme